MDDENDIENDLFEEYGDDNFREPTNEPQIEENVAQTDGNEEPTREVVPVPKRIVRNPRLKFNAERLCGERGIPILTKHFKNVKFKGKGYEKEDLNKLLSTLEHWSHRLFPSMKFDACLRQIEKLGKKRPVQTCLVKIRKDMPILNSDFVNDEEDEREEMQNELEFEPPPDDAFDRLFGDTSDIQQPNMASTPTTVHSSGKALGTSFGSSLTEEQKKRMEYNKMLATERRKARMASAQQSSNDDGRRCISVIDSEYTENSSQITTEPSLAQNLEQQFESLFGEKSFNELNNEVSEKNDWESVSNQENQSEELGLDELMDLVDEKDSSNQLREDGMPSVSEEAVTQNLEEAVTHNLEEAVTQNLEEDVTQNLELQFDSMFDKKGEEESTPEFNQHKSFLDNEDNKDESNLHSEGHEYESTSKNFSKNHQKSTNDDSSEKMCEFRKEDSGRNVSESINVVSKEDSLQSFPAKENELDELGMDELMDLMEE